uniref:GCK domain-containing protein n=1 Tax=Tetraselmis sp. GSL018 TaxID=582737 RepID=A0A061SBZ6_9CHLO
MSVSRLATCISASAAAAASLAIYSFIPNATADSQQRIVTRTDGALLPTIAHEIPDAVQETSETAATTSAGPFDDSEEEEEETCGFCIFMKGGPCKKEFVAWSNCVDVERERGSDFTEECQRQTLALQSCMMSNADYYGPMLEAERSHAEGEEAGSADSEVQDATTDGSKHQGDESQ